MGSPTCVPWPRVTSRVMGSAGRGEPGHPSRAPGAAPGRTLALLPLYLWVLGAIAGARRYL